MSDHWILWLAVASVAYPPSVGLAVRLWAWAFSWNLAHMDDWGNRNGDECGHRVIDWDTSYTVRCPGCSHRRKAWTIATFWPVTFPIVLVAWLVLGTASAIIHLARATGPKVLTGPDR